MFISHFGMDISPFERDIASHALYESRQQFSHFEHLPNTIHAYKYLLHLICLGHMG
jgi:type II secretory pathway predicted ATPase ExeA